MTVITIDSTRLLALLTEIGRNRALTDKETDLIEDIVMGEREPFRWNARLDLVLERAAKCPGGIARFARRHDITASAAYNRLCRIRRKREGRKSARRRMKG